MTVVLVDRPGIVPDPRPLREADDPVRHAGQHTLPDAVLPRALVFDPDEHLWGAGQGGLARWTLTPAMVSYKVWHPEHGLAGADAVSLFVHDGNVCVGHESGLISVYTPDENTWTILDTASSDGIVFPVRGFGLNHAHHLLACTDGGLYDLTERMRLPFPEPAFCAANAFGVNWIGAESGLWQAEPGSVWEPVDLGFAFSCVKAVKVIDGALWAVGIEGVARLDKDGSADKLPIGGAAHAVEGSGGTVYALTAAGLWEGTIEGKTRRFTKGSASLLAASAHFLVNGTSDKLEVHFLNHPDTRSRALLPPVGESPRDCARVFTTGSLIWLQSTDGALWRGSGKAWTRLEHPPCGALSGALAFGEQTILAFESHAGIGLAAQHEVTLLDGTPPSCVTGLALDGDSVVAETIFGPWRLQDGKDWVKVK